MQKNNANLLPKYTVGIAVIYDGKILILRRKKEDFLGGFYEIPGGRVENNESFGLAAKRELKEETGLELVVVTKILDGFSYFTESEFIYQVNLVVTVKNLEKNFNKIVLSEHDKYIWVSKNELKKHKFTQEMSQSIIKILGMDGDL